MSNDWARSKQPVFAYFKMAQFCKSIKRRERGGLCFYNKNSHPHIFKWVIVENCCGAKSYNGHKACYMRRPLSTILAQWTKSFLMYPTRAQCQRMIQLIIALWHHSNHCQRLFIQINTRKKMKYVSFAVVVNCHFLSNANHVTEVVRQQKPESDLIKPVFVMQIGRNWNAAVP